MRAQSIVGTSDGRPEDDFYPTPPEATQALLDVETFGKHIWEPACGNGAMSEVLKAAGYEVSSSDLVDRFYGHHNIDFLKTNHVALFDAIVTNPPFKLAQEFIEHALEQAPKVAMLLKLVFLEGGKRQEFFQRTPLKKVWVFSKRIKMTRNGEPMKNGGMMAFAWFVWDKSYEGEPTIGWL